MIAKKRLIFAILTLWILVVRSSKAENGDAGDEMGKPNNISIRQLIIADFARWDSNQDGKLSAEEINALIENSETRGDEAAAVVAIRRNFSKGEDENEAGGLTEAQLLLLADVPSVRNEFSINRKKIAEANHSLFLPGDPSLLAFQQGQVGDCFLLAVIGALVNRDPQAVRTMIKPLPNNMFEVNFGDGRNIIVSDATDCELLQGAGIGGDHGIWLSILEKAYANLREANRNTQNSSTNAPDNEVPRDFLRGGRPAPAIEHITGHKAASTSLIRLVKNNPQAAAKQIHELLIPLTNQRRLATVGTLGKKTKLPPRVTHGHIFAVLAYDSDRRMVRVFNPWGEEFTPTGIPGLANGYVTRHGMFEVPLLQFIQIFKMVTYETDQSLDK
jgi:hypothetical protein